MRKALPAICSLLLLSVLSVGCEAVGSDDTGGAGALAGAQWQLVSAETAEGTVQAEALSEKYTIKFTSEETKKALGVGGQNACNSYGGSYRVDGKSITIFAVISTRAFCSEAAAQVDEALFSKVQENASYGISGDRLTLSYKGGDEEKQIIFERTSENQ